MAGQDRVSENCLGRASIAANPCMRAAHLTRVLLRAIVANDLRK
jgi:hypothetical protein